MDEPGSFKKLLLNSPYNTSDVDDIIHRSTDPMYVEFTEADKKFFANAHRLVKKNIEDQEEIDRRNDNIHDFLNEFAATPEGQAYIDARMRELKSRPFYGMEAGD
jgi:hypothetical protein